MSAKLLSPVAFRELKIRNRIWMSPMCQYSAQDGVPNEWHQVHLGSRAAGGVGLVIVEATAVTAEGRITPADLGIWNDQQVAAFRSVTQFVKSQGASIGIQLAHAGRKASCDVPWRGGQALPIGKGGWLPVAPSALAFHPESPTPRELSKSDLSQLTEAFVQAAGRALSAGFEIVELHAAHGYLMHEFLSPLSNHRKDEFGGSLENRMRWPLQVAQAVREAWPAHLPVFVRISATDWAEGGWDLDSSIAFCQELKKRGIDLIDVSTGGLVPHQKIPVGPHYQVPFSEAIRAKAEIPTAAVGMITEALPAEEILTSQKADAVLLARELLRNPYWALQAAHSLKSEIKWPDQYARAQWVHR